MEACANCGVELEDFELCLQCHAALCTPCSETPHGLCCDCFAIATEEERGET